MGWLADSIVEVEYPRFVAITAKKLIFFLKIVITTKNIEPPLGNHKSTFPLNFDRCSVARDPEHSITDQSPNSIEPEVGMGSQSPCRQPIHALIHVRFL